MMYPKGIKQSVSSSGQAGILSMLRWRNALTANARPISDLSQCFISSASALVLFQLECQEEASRVFNKVCQQYHHGMVSNGKALDTMACPFLADKSIVARSRTAA